MRNLSAAVAFSVMLTAASAQALEFPTGAPKIDVIPDTPISIEQGEEIVLRGAVSAGPPVTLVLRIDDGHSSSYATRVNMERELPPGPFSWRIPIAGAKTSGGALLDAKDIRRLMLFESNTQGRVTVERFAVEAGARLPKGAIGYSLGMPDAPVLAGLTRISPGDSHIKAAHPTALRRPGLDPVVSNGVIGLEQFVLDLPPGRITLSLWLEDIGDWENLPRLLRRRIRINGVDVIDDYRKPGEWLRERYLAGRTRESGPNDDAWHAHGRFRGGLFTKEIDIGADGLRIEFAGDTPAATYMSAIVVEPAGQTAARDMVENERKNWLNGAFPVGPAKDRLEAPVFDLDQPSAVTPIKLTLAPGTGGRATFALKSGKRINHPALTIIPPVSDLGILDIDVYGAQWRLDRPGAGSVMLVRQARHLRGDAAALPITAEEPRRYEAWISAPPDATPGSYSGGVDIAVGGATVSVPIDVEVLPVKLPDAPAPAGFYLDEAPHLTWFDEMQRKRGAQLACDLHVLGRFGVNGNAPGLATPTDQGLNDFIDDMRRATEAGGRAQLFAYTPLKRLLQTESLASAPPKLVAAMQALQRAGVPAPIWSIADEPGNPDAQAGDIMALSATLRAGAPGIKLGAQFNNPHDVKFIDAIDTVLINDGFGIDVEHIASLRRRGRDVWLYNTGKPRFTAGLWLWFTGASHYLQWHARMPTADPYDPTDGREGDVQVFWPMAEVCAAQPDVDLNLFEMAEGLVDQRWLAWLSSRKEPEARALEAKIRADLPSDFVSAAKDADEKSQNIRKSIVDLARGLK